MDTRPVRDYFTALQARIVASLEALDGSAFTTDHWQRTEGGGGATR
jgi:coproporphyrinogen III oxidase